jgi:hypothetical protein
MYFVKWSHPVIYKYSKNYDWYLIWRPSHRKYRDFFRYSKDKGHINYFIQQYNEIYIKLYFDNKHFTEGKCKSIAALKLIIK